MPAGAFRGYGLPQTLIAVESAIDELARQLGISPFEMRRRNIVKPGDPMLSPPELRISRRGLRFLRARPVPRPGRARDGRTDTAVPNLSSEWLIGDGIALSMIDTVPPAGHIADCFISLRDDGGFDLTVGTAEFGNGTATVHRQIAATALATTVDQNPLKQSDTANGGHDTGAYGSSGTFVAGLATKVAAENLAAEIKTFAARAIGARATTSVLDHDHLVTGNTRLPFAMIAETARAQGETLSGHGNSGGTPRSVAFNVQGFRVAVNKAQR